MIVVPPGHDDPRFAQRIGATVDDKYTLVRVIGTGGMGAVYEAVHVYTQKHVALKLMRNDHLLPDFVERFLREAQAPGSIGHPGIVQVLDAGQDEDGSPYLVLELLEGEDLHDALEARKIDPLVLCDIVLAVLDALAAAHAHGFVHRDIKPENVFLTREHDEAPYRARLLDFGIAKRLDTAGGTSVTHTGAVLGTPDFMSPEQARGEAVDARADLWATGVMLFQGLTGKRPFPGGNYNAVLAAILTRDAPSVATLRPDLPAVLTREVDRALNPSIAKRFQTAQQMSDALASTRDMLRSTGWIAPADDGTAGRGLRGAETMRAWAGVPTQESVPAPKLPTPPSRRLGVGITGVAFASALGIAALWVGARSRVPHPTGRAVTHEAAQPPAVTTAQVAPVVLPSPPVAVIAAPAPTVHPPQPALAFNTRHRPVTSHPHAQDDLAPTHPAEAASPVHAASPVEPHASSAPSSHGAAPPIADTL